MTLFLGFLIVATFSFLAGVAFVDIAFVRPAHERAERYRLRWADERRRTEAYERLIGDTLGLKNVEEDEGESEGQVFHLESREIWTREIPEAVKETRA